MTNDHWKTSDEFPGSISLPFGIKTSHTWHEIGQILRIINDYDIISFAELGCHVGGLGTMLSGRATWRTGFRYYGFELNPSYVDKQVMNKLDISLTDIFNNAKSIYMKCKMGNTFIYCDNGDKVREMQVFSTFLQTGDIIACHDYFDNQNVYGLEDFGREGNTCGCAPEVWKKDVQFLFDDPSFEPLSKRYLEDTRIVGFIKK